MNFLRQFWGIALIVFPLAFDHAAGLKIFYASDFCSYGGVPLYGTIVLGSTRTGTNSSAILEASFTSYPANLNCNITIKPPGGHGVVASIRKIDFRSGCVDSIKLLDANRIEYDFCQRIDDYNSATSVSSNGQMTVLFRTGSPFSGSVTLWNGFQITLTAYTPTPCSTGGYRCDNYRCISRSLTCDWRNHCGDRSDQSDCGGTSRVGKTVGSVFGTIFLIIAIIAGIVYCRRRGNRTVVTTVHQPPQPQHVQQPHPSAYPPQPQYMSGQQPYGQSVNPLYR